MLVAQSCPTLCNPMDCSPPGSSVHGILQARILEWVDIPFSRGSSSSRDWTQVSCIAGRFFIIYAAAAAKLLQLCLTLCDPRDGSPPGSPVPGILQARTLEWVAIPFSRGSSSPRDWTQVSCIAGRFFTIYTAVHILWVRESKVLWVNFRVPFKSIFHHIFARENATKVPLWCS